MAFLPFSLIGGLFLGWSIGAMDFSNVFGTAVTSRMLQFWKAAVLASIFCLIGAAIEGWRGIETLNSITPQSYDTAIISSIAAALAITLLNVIKLPISTSQAVVGSIVGIGIMTNNLNPYGLWKIIICWVCAPIGAALFAIPLYFFLGKLYNLLHLNIFQKDISLRIALIIVGCYASYALGANAVANIAAVFVGPGLLSPLAASLVGGGSIAVGMLTFSKGIVMRVGRGIIKLDAFSSLTAILAEALTIHIFSIIGVPVSTSQALIGAIIGIGLLRGMKLVRMKSLVGILAGWVFAPVIACIFAMVIFFVLHLTYVP